MTDYSFLDEIDSPQALAWAEGWSGRTLEKLASEAEYGSLRRRLLAALDTDERIAYVSRRGDRLYNFWRDADHPRGVWRSCDSESYLAGSPSWEVIIDVDALAAEEEENWVWKGAHVRAPAHDRALIRLSRGGADATVIREFDLETRRFLTDGAFTVTEAKTDVSWLDRDTLLIGTDTGEGSLTDSGYPVRIRLWRRGQPLADAPVFFSGDPHDVAVGAWRDHTPGWERTFASRALDFYNSETFVETSSGLRLLEVPDDCEVVVHRQWLFINPRSEFSGIPAGGLGVIGFDSFLEGSRDFAPVFLPTASVSLQGLSFTRSFLLLTLLDNVSTSIRLLEISDPTATPRPLQLPDHVSAHVVATSALDGDEVWLSAASFSSPATLLRGDLAVSPDLTEVRHAPLQWDNSGVGTRQHWATSRDGTRIPYFISGDFAAPGPGPTLVHAYGGFEVSLTPAHSVTRGIAWLERNRFFVEANIRGGGEFGPEWHSRATKLNRMRVFEDHRAVLEDLVERGYATPAQIVIRGGSNGGLLTSGALTQYPEAFGAAVIQVPLTDMLRYHRLSAGASWMAEYGDPDDPEERRVIERYSPLHNIAGHATRPYPPALVTTSTRDDRVHPAHARLFARALADAGQPVDYYENTEGGHAGAGDNRQVADVEALIYTWIDSALDLSEG
ncbi:prolyl oligopeptidase family serine peptidase [Corynebacterium pacaense]|uniref:prolyl oligopeptidase family serine peptidase n=1 Tax=Corynebacterium pacaense TaxID=1816684 RepID=UPI0009BB450D|nr:prolyl oligopeptidase family serine peptidase [Corynebacterium pacaense]